MRLAGSSLQESLLPASCSIEGLSAPVLVAFNSIFDGDQWLASMSLVGNVGAQPNSG
jgi:hypothetical protein